MSGLSVAITDKVNLWRFAWCIAQLARLSVIAKILIFVSNISPASSPLLRGHLRDSDNDALAHSREQNPQGEDLLEAA